MEQKLRERVVSRRGVGLAFLDELQSRTLADDFIHNVPHVAQGTAEGLGDS